VHSLFLWWTGHGLSNNKPPMLCQQLAASVSYNQVVEFVPCCAQVSALVLVNNALVLITVHNPP
jgi:hypothetical protein